MNYKDYEILLKNRDSKKLENNTYLIRLENGIAVKLHETHVILFNPDNSIILNSGGWKSRTTLDRINKYQKQVRIYTHKYIWYYSINGKTGIFQDNMKVKNNKVTGALNISKEKTFNKLANKINKYSINFIDKLYKGKIEKPGAGDCWFCLMKGDKGRTINDKNHLLSHLKENYFVPSLLVNALTFNNEITVPIINNVLYYVWEKKDITELNKYSIYESIKYRFTKSLKKYLKHNLL